VHITPFPVYPELHAQAKLPGMFVHVAVPTAQLSVPIAHSLMSEIDKQIVSSFLFETEFPVSTSVAVDCIALNY